MTDVRLGQEYADLHPFARGRTFRVDLITLRAGRAVAVCTVLTNVVGMVTDMVGGRVTIDMKQFTEDRYNLIREAS